jgi:capsid protein
MVKKRNFSQFFKNLFKPKPKIAGNSGSILAPRFEPDLLSPAPVSNTVLDGDKFLGGFGTTELQYVDYWTLRLRSNQLFNDNLYARGIIRRLVTNEINTGLTPEAFPDEEIIGLEADSLNDWTETIENRFLLWGKSVNFCDWNHQKTFGAIQEQVRLEALVGGDVLVVLHQSPTTRLPMVELIRGEHVQTPLMNDVNLRRGHEINHGVETDAKGRVIAHWVNIEFGKSKRVSAFGEKSGRRISWLVYGTDKRIDEVRGMPLLTIFLQSLKEIDRYRDSAQRKAVINSFIALFMKKSEEKPGTLPMTGGAQRRDSINLDDDNQPRDFKMTSHIPGMIMEELQVGEEPVAFESADSDINFGEFEKAIIQAVAWANQIPPEILTLAFSNNYSASQAAINEFKIYLNKIWSNFGEEFCTPIYHEWLISEVLNGNVSAAGFIEAWRDKTQYATFAAWSSVDWYGSIKPSTDMVKQGKGSKLLVDEGWSTNARESRINTGTKFIKNIKRLKRENELKVEAMRPLAEFQQEFGEQETEEALKQIDTALLDTALDEYLENNELSNTG